jgi:hypothetical protein
MERTIRDLLTRVDGLIDRVGQQPTDDSLSELRAIRTALKGLLSVAQARGARRPPFGGDPG